MGKTKQNTFLKTKMKFFAYIALVGCAAAIRFTEKPLEKDDLQVMDAWADFKAWAIAEVQNGGTITKAEVNAKLDDLGLEVPKAHIDAKFDEVDSDDNHAIDQAELEAAIGEEDDA